MIISITGGHFGDGSNVRREQEDISRSKPAGLPHDRASFVLLPDRAEIVRKIFELAIGGMGNCALANYLDERTVASST